MNLRKKKRIQYQETESDSSDSEYDDTYKNHNIKKSNKQAYNNLIETKLEILKSEPKIIDILEQPLLVCDRARLLQLYEIYKITLPESEQWLELRNNINKLFDECKNNYIQHSRYSKEQHIEMNKQLQILNNYDPNIDLQYKILRLRLQLFIFKIFNIKKMKYIK